MLRLLVIGALLAVAAVMLYIRYTPANPKVWHVDPRAVRKPRAPNHWLVRPVGGDATPPEYRMSAPELSVLIDRIARAQPDTRLFAGSVLAGHMTYVARTGWLGWPDFISIRIYGTEKGASLVAFSRARFLHRDDGANRARLERWIMRIDAAVREAGEHA